MHMKGVDEDEDGEKIEDRRAKKDEEEESEEKTHLDWRRPLLCYAAYENCL